MDRYAAGQATHALRYRRITVGALCDALDGLPSGWVLVPNPVTGTLVVFDTDDLPQGYIDYQEAAYVEFD